MPAFYFPSLLLASTLFLNHFLARCTFLLDMTHSLAIVFFAWE